LTISQIANLRYQTKRSPGMCAPGLPCEAGSVEESNCRKDSDKFLQNRHLLS